MKQALLIFSIVFCAIVLSAQTPNFANQYYATYRIGNGKGDYEPGANITSATTIISSSANCTSSSAVQSMGINFQFGGTNYTNYEVYLNGAVRFGNNSNILGNVPGATGTIAAKLNDNIAYPLICPMYSDAFSSTIQTTTGVYPGVSTKIVTDPLSGNQMRVLQWMVGRCTNGNCGAGGNCNTTLQNTYQVHFIENTNQIHFVFPSGLNNSFPNGFGGIKDEANDYIGTGYVGVFSKTSTPLNNGGNPNSLPGFRIIYSPTCIPPGQVNIQRSSITGQFRLSFPTVLNVDSFYYEVVPQGNSMGNSPYYSGIAYNTGAAELYSPFSSTGQIPFDQPLTLYVSSYCNGSLSAPVSHDTTMYYSLTPNGTANYTGCNIHLYDEGGPSQDYLDNGITAATVTPSNAAAFLRITGSYTIGLGDSLLIRQGNSFNSPLIGAYTNTSGTVNLLSTVAGGPVIFILKSDASVTQAGINFNVTCELPACTGSEALTTNAINQTLCAGGALNVGFNLPCTANNGNVFTAQLSDAAGSFTSPVNIGSVTSTTATSVAATIPANTPAGNGYRIRVVASNPAVTGSNNGSALTVNTKTFGTLNAAICSGQAYLFNGVNRTQAGSYTDTLVNANGCDSILTLNLSVNSAPSASVTPSASSVCSGSSATLTAGGGSTYNWSNNLGTTAQVIVLPTGATTYTVTVTDANSCSATASVSIGVNSLPNAGITPASVAVCQGGNATLTATGGTAYAWSNSLGSNAQVTVTPGVATTYTVTVTNATNCSATASRTVTVNSLPAATITPATVTICSGESATLTAAGGVSYSWNNSLGSGAVKSVSPTSNTTYTVTVTDVNNCSATASRTVNVNQLPAAGITPLTVTICNGESTTLTATGGVGYSWNNSLGNGAAKSVSPTTNTTYTVTVTDANNCSATASRTVNVNQLPTPTITPQTASVCNGESTTLTAGGGTTYNWSNSGSAATTVVAPNTSTTYTVTVTDGNNCSATASRLVTVNQLPNPTINGPTTVCLGLSATLTAGGGVTYTWGSGLGSGAVKTVTPSATTTYSVTVTDANNCSASATQTVSVTSSPTATISGPGQTCAGQNITLTANGGNTYSWSNGLGNNAAISVSPTTTTTYTVTATVGANCSASASQTVLVNQPAATQVTESICSGDSYTFNGQTYTQGGTYTANLQTIYSCDSVVTLTLTVNALPQPTVTRTADTLSTQSFATYQWLLNGNAVGTTQKITITQNGNYSVVVTDANGCSDTSAVLNVTGVGIADIGANNIKLYPNPTTGLFTVEFADNNAHVIEITDVTGRVVLKQTTINGNRQLNLNDTAEGIYYLHTALNGQRISFKLSIAR